jgi:hypothetical protein
MWEHDTGEQSNSTGCTWNHRKRQSEEVQSNIGLGNTGRTTRSNAKLLTKHCQRGHTFQFGKENVTADHPYMEFQLSIDVQDFLLFSTQE